MTERRENSPESSGMTGTILRQHMVVKGLVQGVGFRPFVYRLAVNGHLSGWVKNSTDGVHIEVEGHRGQLRAFLGKLKQKIPPRARLDEITIETLPPAGYHGFAVRTSDHPTVATKALIHPDIATCGECLAEIFDPANRRFRYPFTNCTNCGPRFSIITSLPYDRKNTTMSVFPMCAQCAAEYENPADRRFHAQPNACPVCGPHLELWDTQGRTLGMQDTALREACAELERGKVLALKGLGGFQLIIDAGNDEAVKRLRRVKARPDKPFAMMYPDLASVRDNCVLSDEEATLLVSPESPIVLARRRQEMDRDFGSVSRHIAPDIPYLGVMLPYTPLHHLLMAEVRKPVVATSGNLADEPICIDEHEALERLRGLADVFLVHNRPIARQMDDSVVQIVAGEEMVLRSARGYAPTALRLANVKAECLAVGADLKNTVAISNHHHVFLSQFLGDLSTKHAHEAFTREIAALSAIYGLSPQSVCCDGHPDYHSTLCAEQLRRPVIRVQHHAAHVFSCMAEHQLVPPVLGVSWDGTGMGTDGTIWGGEFLRITRGGFERIAHLRPFSLPGGDIAAREPRRCALGLLYEIYGDDVFAMQDLDCVRAFDTPEKEILRPMLRQRLHAPRTSSAGRLFDAVASLIGLCRTASFEGQAAMQVQFAAERSAAIASYEFQLLGSRVPYILDWQPLVCGILRDMQQSAAIEDIAAKYHHTLVDMVLAVAGRAGEKAVVLTGGCFQNRLLTTLVVSALRSAGYTPYRHRRVPTNDGGIALGQICATTIFSHEES